MYNYILPHDYNCTASCSSLQLTASFMYFFLFVRSSCVCLFVCLFLSFISIFPLFFNQLLEVYSQQYRNRVSLFNSSSGLSPFTSSSVASLVCFCFFPLLHFTPLGLVSCAVLLFVFLFGMASKTHDLLSFIPESLFELVRVCLPVVFTGWFCGSVPGSPHS